MTRAGEKLYRQDPPRQPFLCRIGYHDYWWPNGTENQAPICRRCKAPNPNSNSYEKRIPKAWLYLAGAVIVVFVVVRLVRGW